MATLEAPVRPRTTPASGSICHRALLRFPQRRERPPHARRHRQSPRPTGPRVRPHHRRQARQDHGQDQVAEPVASPRRSSASTRRPAKNTSSPPCRRRSRPSRPGAAPRSKSAPACCSASATCMRERKFEFMAWLVFEVSKNWAEADADIAETIDFCEFYAREALRFAKAQTPMQLPGERDTLLYIPLGVGAVIPPWNFPCAIMAGMTLASIVSGNTVILKPSSDSPTIAAKFVELLEEAGMPEGVVNFCPGAGASFGDAVVAHPKTRYIAFTGSREVGLHINKSRRDAGSRPDLDQAHHPRDGRQGRHHRRRRRRHRLRRRRRGAGRIRIPGTEVLGLLARHRRRAHLRQVPRAAEGPRREDSRSAIPPRTPTWARSSTKAR